MLKIYDIGEQVERQDRSGTWVIISRYSYNPGGPITYYDVHELETSGPIETIHLSQIKPPLPEPILTYIETDEGMTRESILDQAKAIVMQDRNLDYGSPEDNFRDIAEMWSTYMGLKFKAHDVAVMMIMVKLSRLKTSPSKEDHWVDIAGYAACGGQAVNK